MPASYKGFIRFSCTYFINFPLKSSRNAKLQVVQQILFTPCKIGVIILLRLCKYGEINECYMDYYIWSSLFFF